MQRAVAAAGYPTPLVRASGGPDDGLGRAFLVMDRAPGRPALSGLDDGLTPAVARQVLHVPQLLATAMARLHALDPDLVRGELEQVREVPVTVPALLATLGRELALGEDTAARTWPARPAGWRITRPGQLRM